MSWGEAREYTETVVIAVVVAVVVKLTPASWRPFEIVGLLLFSVGMFVWLAVRRGRA